jgi:hypothetical protein
MKSCTNTAASVDYPLRPFIKSAVALTPTDAILRKTRWSSWLDATHHEINRLPERHQSKTKRKKVAGSSKSSA